MNIWWLLEIIDIVFIIWGIGLSIWIISTKDELEDLKKYTEDIDKGTAIACKACWVCDYCNRNEDGCIVCRNSGSIHYKHMMDEYNTCSGWKLVETWRKEK